MSKGRKRTNDQLPTYDEFIIPVIQGIKELGGSGTIEEINEKVYAIKKLSDDVLQILHSENDTRTEIEYRLAWTRTYLKKAGVIENSERGVWSLKNADIDIKTVSPADIVRKVKEDDLKQRETKQKPKTEEPEIIEQEQEDNWKQNLLGVLINIAPDAFERLSQRILRESGFVQVEVTGRTGDGGIDGKGILKVGGLISFHIIFQCKKYKGPVSSSQIRDFRGAMQGRADKGIFITTGTFTRDAVREATRDGAPPIDLIDGELLCDKIKELQLGVTTKQIETVEIHEDWFKTL